MLDISQIMAGGGDDGQNPGFAIDAGGDSGEEEEDPQMKPKQGGGKPTAADIGIIIAPEADLEIVVTKKHKRKEARTRAVEILKLDDDMRAYQRKLANFVEDTEDE